MTIADDGLRPDRVEAIEVILAVGAEGGSLTIVGIRGADGWRFRLVRDETTLRALLSKEDRMGLEFWHQSDWVDFDAALALLDQYPWHRLRPLQVRPEFQARTWAAVEHRYRTDKREGFGSLDRWQRLCHVEID